jgi:hypothetical protein
MDSLIKKYINSDDPLNEEIFNYLLEHHEEDIYVDYKLAFHAKEKKEWLELTKDFMAFANWEGGYLVFGVKNATYDLVGINNEMCMILCNNDELMKKTNRYVDPPFKFIRSKQFKHNGQDYVVIHIPELKGITHIISEDGAFEYPTGQEKTILHRGTFYVRRCGGNKLASARDLDEIINKRIDFFRDSLFSKISRVINAPAESEIYVLSQDPSGEVDKKFIINDGPDAIPIKGMSFTVAPSSDEEEINAHISLYSINKHEIPPASMIWKWYRRRLSLNLSSSQKLAVAEFSIHQDAPVFYWLMDSKSRQIADTLSDLLNFNRNYFVAAYAADISGFLQREDRTRVLRKLGKANFEIRKETRRRQSNNPRNSFHPGIVNSRRPKELKNRDRDFRLKIEEELDEIASAVVNSGNRMPSTNARYDAKAFDCFLYARDDQYC